jgi:FAD/FMN-containing dehydrogenase
MRALAPFRKLTKPLADMLRPMRLPEIYQPDDSSYRPIIGGRTLFVDAIDRTSAAMILEKLQAYTGSMAIAQLRVLGGAMARVPVDATAFAHRKSKILVNLMAFYDRAEEKPIHESWAKSFAAALQQSDCGAYVNFLGDEGEIGVRAAYPGATWERLAAIKAQYDPDNLFRLNQNIPPKIAGASH